MTDSATFCESCATCKYWRGSFYGDDNESPNNFEGLTGRDYNSYLESPTTDTLKETFGECRRYPPKRTKKRVLQKYWQVKMWWDYDDKMEEMVDKLKASVAEAEKELESAADDWDKQMSEKKLDKAKEKLNKIVNSGEETRGDRWDLVTQMAPEETLEVGDWIETSRLDWCGEYKRRVQ